MRVTVDEALSKGRAALFKSNTASYALDARLLMMKAANLTHTGLAVNSRLELDESVVSLYYALIEKRAAGMPMQYILNEREFMSLPFYVDERVLIPRPDTEILVETALSRLAGIKSPLLLEIGTGSGCIAVSIAFYNKSAKVDASDISAVALEVASANARANGVSERINFIRSDLFDKIPFDLFKKYDIIISNPPYIASGDIPALVTDVRDYEPLAALDGGDDGLLFYRTISAQAGKYIKRGGAVMFECGCSQALDISRLLDENGFSGINIIKDLAGHDRVVTGIKE